MKIFYIIFRQLRQRGLVGRTKVLDFRSRSLYRRRHIIERIIFASTVARSENDAKSSTSTRTIGVKYDNGSNNKNEKTIEIKIIILMKETNENYQILTKKLGKKTQ